MEPRPGVCTKWARTVSVMTEDRREERRGAGQLPAQCEGTWTDWEGGVHGRGNAAGRDIVEGGN